MDTKKLRTSRRSRIDGLRDVLTVKGKPGFSYRWVNDENNRIDVLQGLGWSVVDDKEVKVGDPSIVNKNNALGSGARKIVGTKKDGTPLTAVLMEMSQDEFDEQQKEKNESAYEPIRQIKQRKGRGEGTYGEVKVS